MKRNVFKGPRFSIRYWRISVTLGSGIAGFNCIHFSTSSGVSARVSEGIFGKSKQVSGRVGEGSEKEKVPSGRLKKVEKPSS